MLKRLLIPLIFTLALPWAAAQENLNYIRHIDAGSELFREGHYSAAINELQKGLKDIPADMRDTRIRVEYLISECSARLGEPGAMDRLQRFLAEYPNSVYSNDIHFSVANLYYKDENYERARAEYAKVDRYELRSTLHDEFDFKSAYTNFVAGNHRSAAGSFRQVQRSSQYGPHAAYYLAYIDYVDGNYQAAKRQFNTIADHSSYAAVIPFYILQIEFLESNYDYVVRHGDALLNSAVGSRETEIARVMGESWFHLGDYEKTLSYMYRYRDTGGEMGRPEYYLVGYSQYQRNDISDAIASLSRVSGPDDKLTQNAAYHLGGAYLRAGDKFRAMQSFSMAADSDYDPVIREDALFNYGKLQYELGGGVFNEAINVLTRYLEEYPDSRRTPEVMEYLVAAYYNSRNYDAAYEAIKGIETPDNNMRTAMQKITYFRALEQYNRGDNDGALRLLDEALDNRFNPKYTALTQFWRGEILFNQGKYSEAVPLFQEYISLSPSTEKEYPIAQYNLGYSHFNLRQWDAAGTWFTRFLDGYRKTDSFRADAFNRLGDVQFARREFWKAIESYDQAASIGTEEMYYSRFTRAVVLGLVDRRERKIESLQEIINSGRGGYVGDAMYELGKTYIAADRFSEGSAMLKRFIADYPASDKYLAALSELGLASQNLGDNTSAINYYKRVVNTAPSSAEARSAMLALRSLYVEMNDVDGYFSFASASGIETDTGTLARDSLTYAAAEKVYLSGSRAPAEEAFVSYLDKYPRGAYRANALYYLSEVRLSGNNRAQAMSALEELSNMYYNQFTVRGLEKLAPMLYADGRYDDAAAAYDKLRTTAVSPQIVSSALSGYFRSVAAKGNDTLTRLAAEDVISSPASSPEVMREAEFALAGIYEREGNKDKAMEIFRRLSSEVRTAEGAASRYKVVENLYDTGSASRAEDMILQFAQEDTPHSYWLGRSYLLLGKIFMDKGDSFQARATLQSIVDGYSPADDGVVEQAKNMINQLN